MDKSENFAIRNAQFTIPHFHIEPSTRWPSIGSRELWEYRELLYFLTWRDIRVRYKQTGLGATWAVIQPLFMMVVFSLFFGRLAGVPSDGLPYPVFTFCATSQSTGETVETNTFSVTSVEVSSAAGPVIKTFDPVQVKVQFVPKTEIEDPGLYVSILEAYDLILIDDSKTSAQRACTIRAIAHSQPRRPWIVIHDFEVDEYQHAATDFRQRHIFKAYNPQTGLVCNQADSEIKSLNRLLKEQSKFLEPDDVRGWMSAFHNA
jgi:hypothetical protein